MSKSLRETFRMWDADQYNLDSWIPDPAAKEPTAVQEPDPDAVVEIPVLKEKQTDLFYRIYPVLSLLLGAIFCFCLITAVLQLPDFGDPSSPVLNEVFERYVEKGTEETGAVNTVAGVILDYRAFDTLGESHVLYTALTAVLILLLNTGTGHEEKLPAGDALIRRDAVVNATAIVIVPCIILFGLYIMFCGHLGPGGGFSGGAVIGSGLILYAIAFGFERIERFLNLKTFRVIVLCALCFYSCSKCYSFFCGANGFESFIRAGVPGRILSGGLILPLNIAVGIVVSCTMYGLYSIFKRGRI